jgi:hypothetical protein
MSVGREQDRYRRRDERRVLEEIRRVFGRYGMTARQATEAAEHDEHAAAATETPDKAPVLTLREA